MNSGKIQLRKFVLIQGTKVLPDKAAIIGICLNLPYLVKISDGLSASMSYILYPFHIQMGIIFLALKSFLPFEKIAKFNLVLVYVDPRASFLSAQESSGILQEALTEISTPGFATLYYGLHRVLTIKMVVFTFKADASSANVDYVSRDHKIA